MIKLLNYRLLQFYINYDIPQDEMVLFYSPNRNILKKGSLELAGINNGDGIMYNNKKVYDNKQYFRNRIYLDCNISHLNTLIPDVVAKTIDTNYQIIMDTTKFNQLIKTLQIRSEGQLDNIYHFTKEGIALSNIALGMSIYRYHILLEPLDNITNIFHLKMAKEALKNSNSLIFTSQLSKYTDICNNIIVLGFKNVFYLNNKTYAHILYKYDETISDQNIIYKSVKSDMIIVDDSFSIITLKKWNAKKISIMEIDKYINEDK